MQNEEHSVHAPDAERLGDGRAAATPFDAAFAVAAIHERLHALEGHTKDTKTHWYNAQAFALLVNGIILGLVTYYLTGRIDQAAKEREINTTNATQMQTLLVTISTGTAQEAEAAAVSLTTFGRYSIPPLVSYLQSEPERASAAEHGLTALALTNAPDVCANLERVLENRTQLYTAQSHTAAIRIMVAVGCVEAIPTMKRYAVLVNYPETDSLGLKKYQAIVRDATQSNVDATKKELAKTFALLHVQ